MKVQNGSVYWIRINSAADSAGDGLRPFLTVQSDALNASRLNTVVMLALTDRSEFSLLPGNVTLEPGEANLTKQYIVNVSQFMTFAKKNLGDRIGSVGKERMQEVYDGIRLVLSME